MQFVDLPFLKRLWDCLKRDDAAGLSAEMTYNWMLSLLPTLMFLFTLFGMFGVKSDLVDQFMSRIYVVAPREAYTLLQVTLTALIKDSNGGVAVLSLLGAIWSASNGVTSIEKALNRAFRCVDKNRGFLRHFLVGLLAVIGLGILMLLSANLVVFGDVIFGFIQQTFWLPEQVGWIFSWLRWSVAIVGLVLISSFIYWLVPDIRAEKLKFRQSVLPGTLVFVPLWILISWLFSLYVVSFGHYSKIYGSMGAIIVLMIWLYLTSYTLIIGGEVNAIISGCSGESRTCGISFSE